MFETNEGIYITNRSNSITLEKKGVKSNRDNNFINELLVANMDFNEYQELKWLNRIDKRLCQIYQSQIMMLLNTEGRYLRITNSKGIEMVFHSSQGRIYLLNYVETRTIDWIGEQTSCHRELSVETNIDGKKRTNKISSHRWPTKYLARLICDVSDGNTSQQLNPLS
jgi:hypothetical protein